MVKSGPYNPFILMFFTLEGGHGFSLIHGYSSQHLSSGYKAIGFGGNRALPYPMY